MFRTWGQEKRNKQSEFSLKLMFRAIKSINQIIDKEIGDTKKKSQNDQGNLEKRGNENSFIVPTKSNTKKGVSNRNLIMLRPMKVYHNKMLKMVKRKRIRNQKKN